LFELVDDEAAAPGTFLAEKSFSARWSPETAQKTRRQGLQSRRRQEQRGVP
jgi:hypothetical protein